MPSSRAVNRSKRSNAKNKRRTLRTLILGLQDDSFRDTKPVDHSQDLLQKVSLREAQMDLVDSELSF